MKRWEDSENYLGADYSDWFILYSRHRDSDLITQSNFDCIWNDLVKNFPDKVNETINRFYFGHWAVGWIGHIMIEQSEIDSDLWKYCTKIEWELKDYAVYDELDYTYREYEYAHNLWQDLSLREKIEYCKRAGESIFAARHNSFPDDLLEYLTVDA